MLRLFNGWCLLSRTRPLQPCSSHPVVQSVTMYTTRLYSTVGSGGGGGPRGGGGGGGKPGQRAGLTVMEAPHPSHLPHHPHPVPPTATYPLYQSRPDTHRGAHFHSPHHYHPHLHPHPQPTHLAPPGLPPHPQYQHHTHLHAYGGPMTYTGSKKKTWNFIHDKMSYDTFFTMKRLIERSRQPDEVLRWVTQNPGKISHNHYPVALQKIGQLLQGAVPPQPSVDGDPDAEAPSGGGEGRDGHQILEHQDFQTLCNSIISDCAKFDNFSIVNCLYAVAALGLPSDSQVVQILEAESQSRLTQFNQKDVSMVFSSSMKLHPGSQHPLTEACLAGLEKNLERERHPQTLFLLLSYYRLKGRALQQQESVSGGANSTPPNPEQLLANRKILRLVKHTLASVSAVRDQEMALLDEMLAACVCEASNKSLELIFSSQLFYQNRQERFISSLAEELPKKVDSITPYTMALIAKYMARHRLRETQLLDTIADFLVKKAEFLDSKVIQKLVFPFSRMNYRPSNEQQFFSRLEEVVDLKALSSPLATVNILMSLFQLGHFPALVLHRVFSSAFINNVTNSPYALIVRRYLSLLDAAVELELKEYTGPRLQDTHKVLMFDRALTTDEVNRKYSYKGLVAEALRQLVGEQNYKQDEVLAPGYYADFVLWLDSSGQVLPIWNNAGPAPSIGPPPCVAMGSKPPDNTVDVITSEFQKFSPFMTVEEGAEQQCQVSETVGGAPESRTFLPHHIHSMPGAVLPSGGPQPGAAGTGPLDYRSYYDPTAEYYSSLAKEHSLESQDSSTLSSPPSDGLASSGVQGSTAPAVPDSLFQFSIGKILEEEGASRTPAVQGTDCELPVFYNNRGPTSLLHSADQPSADKSPADKRQVKRVIMSVNDKWHYCHNSEVLVGSRAMRDRHLRLLGYVILQLPYHELEKLNGIEEVKQYLHQKLLEVPR
ncbi:fas-activated serine/threonine kinase isoform X2 [Thalassophryne amazonica]|uniref:fas-activated serine/threonine kinase isoform X1 n=1 Tax=Thalassophryne amazonica TaxID=390379 RepID=UPI0014725EE9|nr:fas-activated serine/threonine kinase isoform X1 [Thalassophryne amazonica]XP_034038958.1 fas-activated serine/threonine kinase isoform X2 [Thalassophryne amazonica]